MTTPLPAPLDFRVKDLRRLTREDLQTSRQLWRFDGYWQGNDAHYGTLNMSQMGLAMYEWEGFHLVGFTNAKQHPHERWLYRTSTPVGEKQFTSRFFTPDPNAPRPHWIWLGQACAERQDEDRYVESLAGELKTMHMQVIRQGSRANTSTVADLTRQYHLLGGTQNQQPHSLPDLTKAQYHMAHEMLYHYPEWLINHPESADLPRDIVLRMHGLGAIADVLAAK